MSRRIGICRGSSTARFVALIVLPGSHVIAVRMRQPDERDYGTSASREKDAYGSFGDDVGRLF